MEMRKRILMSSAFMILISLAALLSVGGVAIHSVLEREQRPEIVALDSDGFAVGEILMAQTAPMEWKTLEGQIAPYGYQLVIADGQQVVYPAEPAAPYEAAELLLAQPWPQQVQAFSADGKTAVGLSRDGYTVVAMHSATPVDGDQKWIENTLALFLVVGVIFIALMLLFSQIFTRQMMGKLLRPMEELTAGARRIEQGDLGTPVCYTGDGEFATVCSAFNQMQQHLLEEREKNAAYEKARTDLVAGISHDLRTPADLSQRIYQGDAGRGGQYAGKTGAVSGDRLSESLPDGGAAAKAVFLFQTGNRQLPAQPAANGPGRICPVFCRRGAAGTDTEVGENFCAVYFPGAPGRPGSGADDESAGQFDGKFRQIRWKTTVGNHNISLSGKGSGVSIFFRQWKRGVGRTASAPV